MTTDTECSYIIATYVRLDLGFIKRRIPPACSILSPTIDCFIVVSYVHTIIRGLIKYVKILVFTKRKIR